MHMEYKAIHGPYRCTISVSYGLREMSNSVLMPDPYGYLYLYLDGLPSSDLDDPVPDSIDQEFQHIL